MPVSGGYFLTRAVARPDHVSADLLPPRIISLSGCICDFVPDLWAICWVKMPPDERAAEAQKRGLSASCLSQVVDWTTQQINTETFGWPCVFFSARDAREFARRYLPNALDVKVLGIALHADTVEAFLAAEKPEPSEGTPGIYKAISSGVELESGGANLGWEVLCYDHGGFHSWLCNGLENEIAKSGIRPNTLGFIASATDAARAAEYCSRDEVGAEPGFWAPLLVVEYPLT